MRHSRLAAYERIRATLHGGPWRIEQQFPCGGTGGSARMMTGSRILPLVVRANSRGLNSDKLQFKPINKLTKLYGLWRITET